MDGAKAPRGPERSLRLVAMDPGDVPEAPQRRGSYAGLVDGMLAEAAAGKRAWQAVGTCKPQCLAGSLRKELKRRGLEDEYKVATRGAHVYVAPAGER